MVGVGIWERKVFVKSWSGGSCNFLCRAEVLVVQVREDGETYVA